MLCFNVSLCKPFAEQMEAHFVMSTAQLLDIMGDIGELGQKQEAVAGTCCQIGRGVLLRNGIQQVMDTVKGIAGRTSTMSAAHMIAAMLMLESVPNCFRHGPGCERPLCTCRLAGHVVWLREHNAVGFSKMFTGVFDTQGSHGKHS